MASVERREGKRGVSYRITVSCGLDGKGHQIKRTKTWKPEPGMTARQIEKALEWEKVDFERMVEQGFLLDSRQAFAKYAEYVLGVMRKQGAKKSTLDCYEIMLERINQAIGHLRLEEIRPQHLNLFYQNLQEKGIREDADRAVLKVDLNGWLKANNISQVRFAKMAGCSLSSVRRALRGEKLRPNVANAIASTMGKTVDQCFDITTNDSVLSTRTILNYHSVISSILRQAKKEMLVPYNAATRASPPRKDSLEPNYFQPDKVEEILRVLDEEPLKWRAMLHLLIVTGCRRGEIVGLKWDNLDLENKRIIIDKALLPALKGGGVYEETTKTRDVRYQLLPFETVQLLKEHRKMQEHIKEVLGERWQETGYVFTRDNGLPINPGTLNGWLRGFSRRHGFSRINPHAFRHTAASILIASGTDVVTVSKHLGHASVTTTEGIYSHLIEEKRAQAAECIADVLLRKK